VGGKVAQASVRVKNSVETYLMLPGTPMLRFICFFSMFNSPDVISLVNTNLPTQLEKTSSMSTRSGSFFLCMIS